MCLDDVKHRTGCGRAEATPSTGPLMNSQAPYLLDIPVGALRWCDLLYKAPCHGGADVPTALGGRGGAAMADQHGGARLI